MSELEEVQAVEPVTPTIDASEPEAPILAVEEEDDGPIDIDAPEQAEATTETEGQEENTETEAEPDPWAGYVDVEIDGEIFKVPEKYKDGYLRQADYTRKTQEAATLRKELETKQADIEKRGQVTDEMIEARAAMVSIDQQLQRYQNVDWDKLDNEDPMLAQSEFRKFQQLKETRNNVEQYQTKLQNEHSQFTEQDTANRLKATAEFAQREIKGWTPDMDAKITEFALKELQIDRDTLARAYTPQVYKILHKAWLGEQTLLRQATAKPAQAAIQPTKSVTAKGSPAVTKDPEEMSMAEYDAYRKSQERKR